MRQLMHGLCLLATLSLLPGCLAEARSVDELCTDWEKEFGSDPSCGKGESGSSGGDAQGLDLGGSSSGGDASGGSSGGSSGGATYSCSAADVKLAEQNGGIAGVIGSCFLQNSTTCATDSNCLGLCLANLGASPDCTACIVNSTATSCMVKSCMGGLAGTACLPVVGSAGKCTNCCKNNCMADDVKACAPPS